MGLILSSLLYLGSEDPAQAIRLAQQEPLSSEPACRPSLFSRILYQLLFSLLTQMPDRKATREEGLTLAPSLRRVSPSWLGRPGGGSVRELVNLHPGPTASALRKPGEVNAGAQ